MSENLGYQLPPKERLAPPDFSKVELPPPLPYEIQPSRADITPFVPHRKLFFAPDLPHHGQLHGEETMMWTSVILRQAYLDVNKRKGPKVANNFIAGIDQKALLHAAAYHDCGRMSDWPVWKNTIYAWPQFSPIRYDYGPRDMKRWENENKRHGPRGAQIITEPRQIREIDPTMTDEQKATMRFIIQNHTPDVKDLAAQRNERRQFETKGFNIEDYDDPQHIMLRMMQEADTLAKARLWYSHPTYGRVLNPVVARMRTKALIESKFPLKKNLVFPNTTALIPLALAHHAIDRHDPELNAMFPGRDRTGVALEAGERLGILKP